MVPGVNRIAGSGPLSERSNWIRLHTLVILRWVAIVGQSAAIVVAAQIYRLDLPIGLCVMTVGIAVIANLVAISIYPRNRRLREAEAVIWLLFDILQLSVLLFLTGGLNNPFAVLILAPVTIAATFLHLRQTVLLGLLAIGSLSLVAFFHMPLQLENGETLKSPRLFLFGFWLALVTGVTFLGLYAHRVITEVHNMSDALTATQLAFAREQKLTDLGGVVAAAAHELGTPLATIKLTSNELMAELEKGDLYDDAALIREQADRCRDILRSMGRAGKDDLHLRHAPLQAVIEEAAEPHVGRGKSVSITPQKDRSTGPQPVIPRRPEIIHGLRNLMQNAVDFATSEVEITFRWTDGTLIVGIADDGRGFPKEVLGRIGTPYMNRRSIRSRPEYDGMGLGLFIAKTLLERSGARIDFTNAGLPRPGGNGALVVVSWPRSEIDKETEALPLGENRPFLP